MVGVPLVVRVTSLHSLDVLIDDLREPSLPGVAHGTMLEHIVPGFSEVEEAAVLVVGEMEDLRPAVLPSEVDAWVLPTCDRVEPGPTHISRRQARNIARDEGIWYLFGWRSCCGLLR